jgi:hypothetical protein
MCLHLCNQLVVIQKGEMSITTYFPTMPGFADEMEAVWKPLDGDDIISYILNGLDADYNSLIEKVNGMATPISPKTLYSRLLDTKVRLVAQKAQCEQKEQYHMPMNAAAHGGNNDNKQKNNHGSRDNCGHQGNGGSPNQNNGGGSRFGNPNNPYGDHQCDICENWDTLPPLLEEV